jgi:hypothetical protein
MNLWIATAGVLTPVAAASALLWHRRGRSRMYAQLAAGQANAPDGAAVDLYAGQLPRDAHSLASAFAAERLLRVDQFVSAAALTRLSEEALSGIPHMDHSFIPLHKKGNTLSYEQILRRAPHLVAFYHSRSLQQWISAVTGTTVRTTPLQDQSSLSVLCYKDAGDHINWHYDHNFYRGRHFTVLLALVNSSANGGPSHSRLERQLPDGPAQTVDMPENTLVVFEGRRVRHRVTPTAAGDLRIVLSMTYCDDPRASRAKEVARRVKDTAFFGLRALWD